MTLIIAFGICFQLPVVLTLLARIELVDTAHAQEGPPLRHRRHPRARRLPDAARPDLARSASRLPMYALYELSILSVRWVERDRAKRLAAEQAAVT